MWMIGCLLMQRVGGRGDERSGTDLGRHGNQCVYQDDMKLLGLHPAVGMYS